MLTWEQLIFCPYGLLQEYKMRSLAASVLIAAACFSIFAVRIILSSFIPTH